MRGYRSNFLKPIDPPAASKTLESLREVASKHGWSPNDGITLRDWLEKKLSQGDEAITIVSQWEENYLKGQ